MQFSSKNKIFIFLLIFLFLSTKSKEEFNVISGNKKALLKFDFYEKIRFLKKLLKPNDLIFDVGANVGKTAEIYDFLKCKIICFEPQPECFNILKMKFKDNQNIILEQIGLGAKNESIDLYLCHSNTISTFSKQWVEKSRFTKNHIWDKTIKAKIFTLNEMIDKYGKPKFIKIDVEGYEYNVLKGLTKPIDLISFEAANEMMPAVIKCIEYLYTLGYDKFNFTIAEKPLFVFPDWMTKEKFIENLKLLSEKIDWSEIDGLWGDVYAKLSN